MLAAKGFLLGLGFLLLIGAALAPRLLYVRLLIGGAALAWLARSALAGDNAGAAWAGALAGLCVLLICRALWEDEKARSRPGERGVAADTPDNRDSPSFRRADE